jgi:16S rRNA processing protein RimM
MQLVVGKIVRPHGIRGEVVVETSTDEPADRFAAGSVLVTDPAEVGPLTIEYTRGQVGTGRLIVAFTEIADRDAAERFRTVKLCVDSADLPDPEDPDEFRDFQLIGLTAVDEAGEKLGTVERVDHGPAADLLVLRLIDRRQALVPFVRAMVPEVDVPGGRVVLTPPPGLLDL